MSEALEKGDLKGLFVNLKKQVCKIIGFILIPEHRSFVKNWIIFFRSCVLQISLLYFVTTISFYLFRGNF